MSKLMKKIYNPFKTKTMKTKTTQLIDQVDDGFNYFLGYRLKEVNTDDRYYIESFIDYIEYLEIKVDRLSKKLRNN